MTIWGESAGGLSVGMHLTAYGGRDDRLFHGAIMQSGSPIYYNFFDHNQTAFDTVANGTGCGSSKDPLKCLRELPFDTLNTFLNSTDLILHWKLVIDNDIIKGKTSLQLEKGEFVHVPIISGANSDEGTAFGPSPVDSEGDFVNFLEGKISGIIYLNRSANNTAAPSGSKPVPASLVSDVLKAYPSIISYGAVPTAMPVNEVHPLGANYRRSAAYYGDSEMISQRRLTCQTWAAFGLSAHCYRFNTIPNGLTIEYGATHFQEVAFVFNNKKGRGYATNPFANKTSAYEDLSDLMSTAWIGFVSSGEPGAFWPKYTVADGHDYVFDAEVDGLGYAEKDDYRKEGIDLINSWNSDVYDR